MKPSARSGCVLLMAAAIWTFADHHAGAAPPQPDAKQAQAEARRNPWNWLKSRATQLQAAARRKATAEAATDPEAPGRIGWTFHQIDAPEALRRLERFGLEIPVAVEGRVTIQVRVGVPWRTVFQARNYRLSAHVQSARLTVAGVKLDDLDARLSYAEGLLKLSTLHFATPDLADPNAKVGVRGTAQVQLEPRGDLTANVDFARLSLGRLLENASPANGKASGEIAGHAEAQVAIERFRDLAAWRGKARLEMDQLRLAGSRPLAVTADLGLADGVARLPRLVLRMKDSAATISGDATAQLQPRGELKARLNVDRLELAPLLKGIPTAEGTLAGELGGSFAASAPMSRLREPASWRANGRLNASDLRIAGLPPARLAVDFRLADGRLMLPTMNGQAEFVDLSGSGRLDLSGEWAYSTNLRLTSSRLSRLSELKGKLSLPIEIGGRLGASAVVQGALKPGRFSARGAVTARDVRVEGIAFDEADFRYDFDRERLQLHPFDARLYGGRLRASAVVPLGDGEIRAGVRWNDLQLGPLAERFAKIREPLTGRSAGTLQLRLPRQALDDWAKWAAEGRIDVDRLGVANLAGGNAGADFKLAEGSLQLSRLDAALGPARLAGAIEFGVAAPFDFSGKLSLSNGDLALLELLPGEFRPPVRLAGRTGVSAEFQGSLQPPRLTGRGALIAKSLRVDEVQIDSVSAAFSVDGRQFRLSRLQASLYQGELQGSGRLQLAAPYDFQARFDLADFDLSRLQNLPPRWRPPMELSGRIDGSGEAQGTLDPPRVTGQGKLAATDLNIAGAKIDSAALNVAADDQSLRLDDIAARLYQGRVAGNVKIPLARASDGRASLALEGLDVGRLLSDLGRTSVKLRGKADGKLEAKVPAGRFDRPEAWELHASFDAPEIDADSIRLGRLHARLDYQRGELDYKAEGELLSGQWELAGAWSPPGAEQREGGNREERNREGVNRGHAQLQGAQLSRLGEILQRRGALDSLAGTVNLRFDYESDGASGLLQGQGRFDVEGLRFNGVAWADRLAGAVVMGHDQIRLETLTGSIAGGRLRASGAFDLARNRRGSFRILLDGADLGRLSAIFPGDVRPKGAVDLNLLAFVGQGRAWRFSGAALVRETEIDGISLNDVRLPLEGTFDPVAQRGELRLRDATAQLAHGHVTASASLTSASGLSIDGHGKFTDVRVQQLLRTSATASQYGAGKMTGDFTVAGRNVRSLKDLTGRLKAKLRDTAAASLPLAQTLQSYVSGGLAGSGRFGNGDLRARLARGVVRVERLSLNSQNLRIYAQGDVSLAGRLNLSVVANTGQINSTPGALLVAARLSTLVAPPVGLLLEANQLLSNQTVYLDVTGTVHSPTVRVRPLPTLEEEAVRFFLLQGPIP